ncbi:MAG: T9SS type A sorting domain-containing protein [Bacteroidota bacterium]
MIKIYSIFSLLFLAVTSGIQAQTYNYYFGNIHAHSSYSDGNKDSSTSNMSTPLEDFNYANASQQIDFYGISEHNHLSAGMASPLNFHQGIADAAAATVNGSFIALYGMEWGVISGGGHVIVYGYDSLIGWDANDYDVFVAKNNYTGLWTKINERPSSFAYLAHPQTTDYNNLFTNGVNLLADNAIIGMAARSGPAFSTNNTYSDPDAGSYISRYNDALKQGYHLGIGLDHDTHNSVFGRQCAGRLVVLAPALTKADLLEAFHKMRFYSSDDWNTKVDFTISAKPMGSILTQAGNPTINVTITDPDLSETVSSIKVYSGIPGSGAISTILNSNSGSSNLTYTHSLTNNATYYYYLKITQADGDIIWTSPIWYTRNDAVTNAAPIANFTPSADTVCVGQQMTFTDNSTNAPADWSWSLPDALPATSSNQSVIASFTTPGVHTVSLTVSNAFGASAPVSKTINAQVCTAIEEASKSLINVFPNPADACLTVEVKDLQGSKTIEIYDVSGRLMLSEQSSDTVFNVDLASFENGSYFIYIKMNNEIYTTQQFIVNKK